MVGVGVGIGVDNAMQNADSDSNPEELLRAMCISGYY